jgi:hypothetical protein
MARWTDQTAYPSHVPNDDDLLVIADVAQATGSRQRTTSVASLRSQIAGQAHVAAVDPTASDDNTEGYSVGSLWYNSVSEALFIATDVSTGAAVWDEITSGAGGSPHATINSYAGNRTLDGDDAGAYLRITAAGTVTLPNGLDTGFQCSITNQTDAADVDLDATTTLVLPAGFTEFIENRRAVTVIHVGSNVWEVHGALVEEVGS